MDFPFKDKSGFSRIPPTSNTVLLHQARSENQCLVQRIESIKNDYENAVLYNEKANKSIADLEKQLETALAKPIEIKKEQNFQDDIESQNQAIDELIKKNETLNEKLLDEENLVKALEEKNKTLEETLEEYVEDFEKETTRLKKISNKLNTEL